MTKHMADGNLTDGSTEVSMVNITDILDVDDVNDDDGYILESGGCATATTIQIVIFSNAYVWNEGSKSRLERSHIEI